MDLVISFRFLMEKNTSLFGNLSLNLLKSLNLYKVFSVADGAIYLFIFALCNLVIGEPKICPLQKCWRFFKATI